MNRWALLLAAAGLSAVSVSVAGDRVFDYDRGSYHEIGNDNSVTSGNQVRYFDYDTGTNKSYQVETWQDRNQNGFGARIYDPSSHEYRQLDQMK
ncbi:MAG: DUF5334 family protein [Gammaproteobacteria bacterium]|nr:DUF5334 family protein [Gammaproteobacteria bacterium]MCP5137501.1 DUF5334 family protein [Gammaproteobacteria bacterium]